jgi:hypothetical protein
MRKV